MPNRADPRRPSWHRLLLPVLLVAAAQAVARPIAPADIVDLKQVGEPQVGADGLHVAYAVETPLPDGKPRRSRLHVVRTDGSGARALPAPEGSGDREPRWAPQGRILGFLSTRPLPEGVVGASAPKPAATQVWAGPLDGPPRPLTAAAGEIRAFAWSPDGAHLAYIAVDPVPDEARAQRERKDDAVEVDGPRRFARLWIQPTDAPQDARAITPPALQVHDAAWSPDGRRLALRVSDDVGLNDYWYRSRIVIVDAADGRLLRTLHRRTSAAPLRWSPDGDRLLHGELGPYGMTATLVVREVDGDGRVALAEDWPGTLWAARWRDGGTLVGQGLRGVRARFLRIEADTGRAEELASVQAAWAGFGLAADGGIVYLGSRADTPPEIWAWRGGEPRPLTRTNPQVADWSRGRVRELSWRSSRDGREIHGVLVLPPDWRPGTRLPTLVQIHGGPAWAWWSGWLGSWHEWAQLLASHGYAVLMPNPRGSEGQGAEFARLVRGDWGGADFQDVLDGLDRIEAEGIVDPARVAIGGWSYGGYLSAWAAAHSDRFRTAIVGAGIADIGAMALTTDTPDYLPGYFGDPLARREVYDRHSPIRYAARIEVPVLILHGEADARVPVSQGEMLHGALKFTGTPVEMVRYPRGPHWFHEREHERDVLERVLGWLDRHLRTASP